MIRGIEASRAGMAVEQLRTDVLADNIANMNTSGFKRAAATSVGGRHAATACGLLNTGGNVVGGLAALLVPFTAERAGWPVALGTASLFAVAGALLWLGILADREG